ncbi:MAG: FAD-dependent oxidoreductase, partial [Gemmatimonas sp.]|nr:FAD-dependent oxidoreductase [Gemmatimonas sp.]
MPGRYNKDLGLNRKISRRDFLNGMSLAIGGSLLGACSTDVPGVISRPGPGYYPPTLTGMRGSHDGSFEVAHQLRDGSLGPLLAQPLETGEVYDLAVVGGGISGLSAAYFFRRAAAPDARMIVLDNHDDFGGHAKRNEFHHDGQMFLLNGGTMELEAPSQYSAEAQQMLRELGVDRQRFYQSIEPYRDHYRTRGMGSATFFDRETFGADRLITGYNQRPWKEFLADAPLAPKAKEDVVRLYEAEIDYMPDLGDAEKKERLARMSYRDFLLGPAGCHEDVAKFLNARSHGLFCMGIDAVPAYYAWNMHYPGFSGMKLVPLVPEHLIDEPGGQHGRENPDRADEGDPTLHFPDGNATVARLLVRSLIPASAPGSTMEDIVTARVEYGRLDEADSTARIRLNSTVVQVRQGADSAEDGATVEVMYIRNGRAERVRARNVVLACWNYVIPHIVPQLPAPQKEALGYGIKAPIVYTSVLLRNWEAFERLGVSNVYAPGSYHSSFNLEDPVYVGDYQPPLEPTDPAMVHMVRTPCAPGLPRKEQHIAGRNDLLTTPFETFEQNIRDQLARTLSGGGFDPAGDILAITVNRWPHGYTYNYNSLYDPVEWALGTPDDRAFVVGRQRFGRITIANADASGSSHTDGAINEAYRAVNELLDDV